MSTRRQKRVAELIHRELSDLLEKRVGDPRVQGVTVTEVDVTPDLRMARVHVTRLGTDEERKAALRGLQRAGGFLRHELGTRVALRHVPELVFFLDNTWQEVSRIDALLEQIRNGPAEENEHEAC